MMREALKDIKLGSLKAPKGTIIQIAIAVLNLDRDQAVSGTTCGSPAKCRTCPYNLSGIMRVAHINNAGSHGTRIVHIIY
jgi:hypothetical protein